MKYLTGRISLIIIGIIYFAVGILLVKKRDDAHRVEIYHSQAYIDCDVDGDNDPNTCVSDYTVVKTFRFNAGYVFGSSLIISGFFSFLQALLQKNHGYSVIYYVDTLISNSIMTFAVAVISGIQGLFILIMMMLNTFMYEMGIYLHDIGYWNGNAIVPYHNKKRFLLLVLINLMTLSVNVAALIEYWSVSIIPFFIPLIMFLWFSHFVMLRFITYKYFYGTLPPVVKRGIDKKESELVFFKGNVPDMPRYDLIRKIEPYVIDWYDHWKYSINLFFKISIGLLFYISTENIKITYK